MSSASVRTHDKAVYLQEDRYERPKEIFKRAVELVREAGCLSAGGVVCDVGCATGEFLYYFSREFPSAKCHGLEIVPELLDRAKQRVPGVEFRLGSVLDRAALPAEFADVTFLLGVHSIFDDVEPCLGNLLRWTRKGGRLLVFGLFNPFPLDVWVKYRSADHPNPDHREPGWNIVSQASVSTYLDAQLGPGRHRFIPFELPFDLEPTPDDLVRTWTFQDARGRRLFTNGLSLLCPLLFLDIRP